MISKLFMFALTVFCIECNIIILPTGSLCDISAAISRSDVSDGDIFLLSSGIWTACDEPINFMSKSITVRGESGVIIDCGGGGVVLTTGECKDIVLENIKIINANKAVYHAGTCHISLNYVDISDVVIGVEAISSGSVVTMTYCVISNVSDRAIYLDDGASVSVTNSYISGGNDGARGACVCVLDLYSQNSTLFSISNSIVTDCRSGALYLSYSGSVTVFNTTFSHSRSASQSGCLSVVNGIITLNSVKFDHCTNVGLDGGAIHASYSTVHLYDVDIENSSAGKRGGGGIAMSKSQLYMEHSRIRSCSGGTGGAIYAFSGCFIVLQNVNISNCTATSGGGLSVSGALTASMIYVNIERCHARYGGAMNIENGPYVTMVNVVLTYNSAYRGGGVHSSSITIGNISLNISKSIISFNNASEGGGIYLYSRSDTGIVVSTYVLTDVTVNNNVGYVESEYYVPKGTGVYVNDNNYLTMNNVTVRANMPYYGVYVEGGSVSADERSIICGNLPSQLYPKSRRSDFGNATICGVITSVTTSDDTGHILWPGADVTVDGTDMMIDENDAIVQADIVTVEISSVPFTFTLPSSRTNAYTGPLVVLSRDGVRSESADDYAFTTVACPISVTSGPTPPRTATGSTYAVARFSFAFGCDEIFSVTAIFNTVTVICKREDSTSYSCRVPSSVRAGYVDVILDVEYSGIKVRMSGVRSYEYYERPVPRTPTPYLAFNNQSEILIYGLRTTYPWLSPRCLFEGNVIVPAVVVSDMIIKCLYYSSSPCELNVENDVRVAIYNDEWSEEHPPIRHICNAVVTGGPSPSTVLIGTEMSHVMINVTGHFYPSRYGCCRYNGNETHAATEMSETSMSCRAPDHAVNDSMTIEVSVNWMTFIHVPSPIMFSYCPSETVAINNNCVCEVEHAIINVKTGHCDACEAGYTYRTDHHEAGRCVENAIPKEPPKHTDYHVEVYAGVFSVAAFVAICAFAQINKTKVQPPSDSDTVPLNDHVDVEDVTIYNTDVKTETAYARMS